MLFPAPLQDEIIDISENCNLAGPSSAVNTPADDTEFSLDELTAAAMETHINSLAVADIEADFTSGAGDEELTGYLSSLQQEAEALLVDGKGPAAEAAAASLEAAAAELLEAGDVPEAEVRRHCRVTECFNIAAVLIVSCLLRSKGKLLHSSAAGQPGMSWDRDASSDMPTVICRHQPPCTELLSPHVSSS